MPLKPALGACREVVHRPLKGDAAVRGCTGRLLDLADFHPARTTDEIASLRQTHQSRLRKEFPSLESSAWLDRYPTPTI